MAYKSHDPERMANSPRHQDGLQDGTRDRLRLEHDPPLAVIGMDPRYANLWTYKAGYKRGLSGDE